MFGSGVAHRLFLKVARGLDEAEDNGGESFIGALGNTR
jgi:hypothetical protein